MAFSPSAILLPPTWLFISLTITYLLYRATYNLYLHPLSSIPAPPLAALTTIPLSLHSITGHRAFHINSLHARYGPIVRLAPNELSFSDPSTTNQLYGQATPYMKSELYAHFQLAAHPGIFESRERDGHRRRRRLLSSAFTAASTSAVEPLVVVQIREFLAWVGEGARAAGSFDVFFGFRMLSLDILGVLFLGASFGAVATRVTPGFLVDLDLHFVKSFVAWNFPGLLPLTSWVPVAGWQRFLGSSRRMHEYTCGAFREYVARNGRVGERGSGDLLRRVLANKASKGGEAMSDEAMSDEAIAAVVGSILEGGTDTTSNVLTFTTWELSRHPEWQRRLREEFEEKGVIFVGGVAPYEQLKNLEVLDAVVQEGLRMYPAAVGSLPRVVPKGGAWIGGVWVPGGTIISMQAYTLHRNPIIFPSPHEFDPARWLRASSNLPAMRESFFAWSSGSRACMGVRLATVELKLIISALVWGWEISAAEGTTAETMAIRDHFVIIPRNKVCRLMFTPVRTLEG